MTSPFSAKVMFSAGTPCFEREIGVERHVAMLAVERDDVSRLDQVEHPAAARRGWHDQRRGPARARSR